MVLQGLAGSSGVGIGEIVCLRERTLDFSQVKFSGEEAEKARLRQALEVFCQDTQKMAEETQAHVGEKEAEILSGQITMVNDPFMISQMEEGIQAGQTAEAALDAVCRMYADLFAGMEDELMRQRATDVGDIRTRVLSILLGVHPLPISSLPAGSVVAVHDLTPSMTVGIHPENIAAIVTEAGGPTSHSAILARALGIPAVLSVPGLLTQAQDGQTAIVDGNEGTLILSPEKSLLEEYQQKRKAFLEQKALLQIYKDRPTLDADGKAYQLYANIGGPAEAQAALDAGAEGIGLFRTEFLFMDRDSLPTEEEQLVAYQKVSQMMAGKEVIIRTLDIGGDKAIPYLGLEKEENPFLGYRAIRYCLDQREIFKTQLRALLRAGADQRNLKIMLPLVTSVEEVREAKKLLAQCQEELKDQGLPYDSQISLGIMVETPAAALTADLLAKEVDFFSIGTNDLTQYIIAVDRGNGKVSSLYTSFHPAVLRALKGIIEAAKSAHIPVGMCGEAASDPQMVPLLLALGLDEFSVSPSLLLSTRREISRWDGAQAQALTQRAFQQTSPAAIQELLAQGREKHS